MKLTTTKQHQQNRRLQKVFAKTAGMFENLFFCCATAAGGAHAVQDDAEPYMIPEVPVLEQEADENEISYYSLKQSSSVSTSGKAIASADSYVSKATTSGGGSAGGIVFLDAMEPRVRPMLRLPAPSAAGSIRTATTASMSSDTIPTIQGSQTFDSECSLYSGSTSGYTRPARSISSATTAKFKHLGRRTDNNSYVNNKQDGHYRQQQEVQSIRRVQTDVLPHLPALSATDGYRC